MISEPNLMKYLDDYVQGCHYDNLAFFFEPMDLLIYCLRLIYQLTYLTTSFPFAVSLYIHTFLSIAWCSTSIVIIFHTINGVSNESDSSINRKSNQSYQSNR